ncbi:PP2C family protein-serine/threonine phosphatase [Singulisphaera sp. Ch08]|uniref:PP2C family protein-serine/threonine phosphatase n=1 Tax=Singulisphaera sp. Ch08 TaxID=3120278 RepID=A0AAU7CML0_9BACT
MIAAPIPVDDAERLEVLRSLDLLDTAPEERFDRITKVLGLVMEVPMAYISLVDSDRQWFKSSCGLNSSETPREISFCGHAILSDEPLVVPDATEDERFWDNPLVLGDPFVRFYAGYPIAGPGGQKVGTLCIADRRPRDLEPAQLEIFKEMAQLVERELGLTEVAHLQQELIASQHYLMRELSQAAEYVQTLLPEPLDGKIRIRWAFQPSSQLGGDFFGYDWIDPDHLVLYLLDVSGHGVGAALLSISVANALRARSLPNTDFLDPAMVLAHLNDAFPMDRHGEKYFTIWYGVYDRKKQTLTYANGGHPPPLLLSGPSIDRISPVALNVGNFAIGIIPGAEFHAGVVDLDRCSKLFVFSDGVYEIKKPGGSMMKLEELMDYLGSSPGPSGPDAVLRFAQEYGESHLLADDFSLVEVDIRESASQSSSPA